MFVTSSAIKRRKIVSVWHICSWNGSSGLELGAAKVIFGTTITHRIPYYTLLFGEWVSDCWMFGCKAFFFLLLLSNKMSRAKATHVL